MLVTRTWALEHRLWFRLWCECGSGSNLVVVVFWGCHFGSSLVTPAPVWSAWPFAVVFGPVLVNGGLIGFGQSAVVT